jgi:hypothetical protein
MKEYAVTWNIDISASSAREAAEEAFKCMQEIGTTAVVFNVCDEGGEFTIVDLLEDPEEQDECSH